MKIGVNHQSLLQILLCYYRLANDVLILVGLLWNNLLHVIACLDQQKLLLLWILHSRLILQRQMNLGLGIHYICLVNMLIMKLLLLGSLNTNLIYHLVLLIGLFMLNLTIKFNFCIFVFAFIYKRLLFCFIAFHFFNIICFIDKFG